MSDLALRGSREAVVPTRAAFGLTALFTVTVFLGAALLFVVQPLVAKLLLPAYGGSATVWSTSSLFFQTLLLVAYLYVHWSTSGLGPRRQPRVHLLVLVLPVLALPLALPTDAAPPADGSPALWLLRTLLLAVGLPFAVVATTGPLLQRWFSWTAHRRAADPYFLFAASNLGSFGGLLAYPFLIEPTMTLEAQRFWWSVGCGVFVLFAAGCGLVTARRAVPTTVPTAPTGGPTRAKVGRRRVLSWLALAFLPSSLMLGVTAHVSTDVAAIPLLWVVPLAIYLATFVAAFARRSRRAPRWAAWAAAVAAVVVGVLAAQPGTQSIEAAVAGNLVLLALVAYAAHGRLAADRPGTDQLTYFYVVVSIGGALGGLFNGLVAPAVFDRVLEYPLGLVAVPLLLLGLVSFGGLGRRLPGLGVLPPVGLAVLLAAVFVTNGSAATRDTVERARTFFGSYRVESRDGVHTLVHGTTIHGTQFTDQQRRDLPTTYYSRSGPLGEVFALDEGRFDRVGAVGLGTGTVAAYGRPGQTMTFFEIDPEMVRMARDTSLFTYLADSAAEIETVVGDGRLTVSAREPGSLDLLVLDAFSSDSIPIHLLTAEAMRMYASRLADDGVLAVHVSNRVFDLEPVVAAAADELRWRAAVGRGAGLDDGATGSVWVVLSRDDAVVQTLVDDSGWRQLDRDDPVRWTDDYSSLVAVLR
ncbi:MAG: hypothetical protein GEU96_15580 [Propionibacteriales bacterium]|nr:hypothetical protein [Propionibacteriales bacterium]